VRLVSGTFDKAVIKCHSRAGGNPEKVEGKMKINQIICFFYNGSRLLMYNE
jgi:hypothetical protein